MRQAQNERRNGQKDNKKADCPQTAGFYSVDDRD